MKTVAVILAGGFGLRMGGDRPKQFLEIDGKPIVVHSLEAFEKHDLVDEIILVVNAAFQDEFQQLLAAYDIKKLRAITVGGKERSDSSKNALKLLKPSDNYVLIHDAVRPFVSERIITDVVRALSTYKAVNVGIPATDTVLMVNEAREIVNMPARQDVFMAQTPQGFHTGVIIEAYARASKDASFRATDDCGVVHRYLPKLCIGVVKGESVNRKITFPTDL